MIQEIKNRIYNAINNIFFPVCCLDYNTKELIYTNLSFNKLFENVSDTNIEIISTVLLNSANLQVIDNCVLSAKESGTANIELNLLTGNKNNLLLKGFCILDTNETTENNVLTLFFNEVNTSNNNVDNNSTNNVYSIVSNVKDAFFSLDKKGNIVYSNKAFETLVNKTNTELSNKSIYEHLADGKITLFEKHFNTSVKDNLLVEFEDYFPALDKWLYVLIFPTGDNISVFLHNITLDKKNHELLVESEQKFHLISENSPMFIWTTDENLKHTFFNKTFINFSGLDSKELIRKDWIHLVHPDDLEKVTIYRHRGFTYKVEINFEARLMRKDGEYRWIKINATPQMHLDGTFNGFLGNGVDITDLKYYYEKITEKNSELENALNESRRLSGMLNKTSNVLVLTDSAGKITWVNDAFTKLTEYTLEEVIGKKPGPLVYGPETSHETMDILHEAIQKKEITRVEILNYSKNGRKIWFDLRIEPIFKNGEPEGYIAIQIDITKRKNDEVVIKERNEKLREFSFITSHELRHEFSKILMILNMAKTIPNNFEDFKNLLQHLEAPADKINSILSKLNTSLTIESKQKDLHERLQEIDEIKEICFVDDDQLTNMVHKQIIKIMMPGIPIRVFENVDSILNYLKIQPFYNRFIFLDLNFNNTKSGWDFLDEYQKMEINAPVFILSSSIDDSDIKKAKSYKCVLDYIIKPLTVDTLQKLIQK